MFSVYLNFQMIFADAEAYCNQMNASLVYVDSKSENDQIYDMVMATHPGESEENENFYL